MDTRLHSVADFSDADYRVSVSYLKKKDFPVFHSGSREMQLVMNETFVFLRPFYGLEMMSSFPRQIAGLLRVYINDTNEMEFAVDKLHFYASFDGSQSVRVHSFDYRGFSIL